MKNMNAWGKLAFILLVIGGLNWGLVGAGGWDIVSMIFGEGSVATRIVFVLVGLSALFTLFGGGQKKVTM